MPYDFCAANLASTCGWDKVFCEELVTSLWYLQPSEELSPDNPLVEALGSNQIRKAYATSRMNQEREAELENLLGKVIVVNEKRNSIIHSRWGCKKQNGEVVSRHRIWKNKDQGIDLVKLRRLRDDIRELRDQLGRYPW